MVPVEFSVVAGGDLGAADRVAFGVVLIIVSPVRQQAVARTRDVAAAVQVGFDPVSVGVVRVTLIGVVGIGVIGARELIAIIVGVDRGTVDVGDLLNPTCGVILEVEERHGLGR